MARNLPANYDPYAPESKYATPTTQGNAFGALGNGVGVTPAQPQSKPLYDANGKPLYYGGDTGGLLSSITGAIGSGVGNAVGAITDQFQGYNPPAAQTAQSAMSSLYNWGKPIVQQAAQPFMAGLGAMGSGVANAVGMKQPENLARGGYTTMQDFLAAYKAQGGAGVGLSSAATGPTQAGTPQSTYQTPQTYQDFLKQYWGPEQQFQYDYQTGKNQAAMQGVGFQAPQVSMQNGMISGGGINVPGMQGINPNAIPTDRSPQIQAAYQTAGSVLDGFLQLIGQKDANAAAQLAMDFQNQKFDLTQMLGRAAETYERTSGQLSDDAKVQLAQLQAVLGGVVSQAGIAGATTDTAYSNAKAITEESQKRGEVDLRNTLARLGILSSSQAVDSLTQNARDVQRQNMNLESEYAARKSGAAQSLLDTMRTTGAQMSSAINSVNRAQGQIGAAYQDRMAQIENDLTMLPEQKRIAQANLTVQTQTLLQQLAEKKAGLVIEQEQAIGGEKQRVFGDQVQVASFNNGVNAQNAATMLSILQTGYGMSKDAATLQMQRIAQAQQAADDKRTFALNVASAMAGNAQAAAELGIKQDAQRLAEEKAAVAAAKTQADIDYKKGSLAQRIAYQNIQAGVAQDKLAIQQQNSAASLTPNDEAWALGAGKKYLSGTNGPPNVQGLIIDIVNRHGGGSIKEQAARNRLVDTINATYFGGEQVIPSLGPLSDPKQYNTWYNSLSADEKKAFTKARASLSGM